MERLGEPVSTCIVDTVTSYTIADLRQQLPVLDAEVARHAAAKAAAEQAEHDARLKRAGAEALIQALEASERESGTSTPHGSTVHSSISARRGASTVGTTAVVENIIRTHPNGIHIQEVGIIAAEQGHVIDSEQVRSAVTYLRRRGDAENIARGVWRPTSPPTNTNGPTEVRPFDLASSPFTAEAVAG